MLDMQLVENTIKELENSDTNFANCDKLSSLYIIREYHDKYVENIANNEITTNVKRELSDILPHYQAYCDRKYDFQMNKAGKDAVLLSLKAVCREISEFIHTLYASTDMPEERDIITGMISNLQF